MRFLLLALLVLMALGLAGWGVVIKARQRPRRRHPARRAAHEAFARFKLPPSARAVNVQEHAGIDYALEVRFEMDRADVDAFVASTGLDVERKGRTLRAEEGQGTHSHLRTITVRLHPDTATVDLNASEL